MVEFQKKLAGYAKKIMPWFFEIKIAGEKNIKNLKGSLIIIAPHKSYADHPAILSSLPENHDLFPIRAIAKSSLFGKIWLGNFLRRAGAIPKNQVREVIKILKDGGVAGVYPEGKLMPEPGIHKFEKGAAFLARKTGAPILPIVICGLENFTIRKTIFTLNNFFRKRKIIVAFGEPFYIEATSRHDDEKNTEQIRQKVSELYQKHSQSTLS